MLESNIAITGFGQLLVFAVIIVTVGLLTLWRTRAPHKHSSKDSREYFLAGGSLTWVYVAGSITITNLGTEQLVGMNGNQMLLLSLWELSAVVGLLILAFVFVPIYYRHNCTTTTELLERRYGDDRIRTMISTLFMFGYLFIAMPSSLYTGALFMRTVFGIELGYITLGVGIAALGAIYGVMGGLRAVAISETFSGASLLVICLVIVWLALQAIGFDFSGIPAERLTLIGDDESPIPWHTLLTGMVFIQIFYWSTNQAITQRAMASPTVREAQKGVIAAAIIRLLIVPTIVVLPGIIAFKLYGDIGDAAFGTIVGGVLPPWLSGAFAAILITSVATHFVAILNSAAALYVCDIHQKYVNPNVSVKHLNLAVSAVFIGVAVAMIPVYSGAESIINLLQELNGLLSMPILSAFIVGLLFRGVDARAAIAGVCFGIALYAFFTFIHAPFGLHYIHLMFVTLITTIAFALAINRMIFKQTAVFTGFGRKGAPAQA
ncbi:MAG: SLC5 family protein [Erythrobacter sp.]|nr:SLC5 family protein [Erythrobacter sp.]MDZ4271486.1 SLC5 family protein [Erythrobacter sp.]MDZ4274765.1 SLC5 family protein [Erythrobacter sp.]